MPTAQFEKFTSNIVWPGSDASMSTANLAHDQDAGVPDDGTLGRQAHSFTLGNKNGTIFRLPKVLPEDIDTLDQVQVRLRIRHDGPPPAPGLIENYHAVYRSYNAGTDWTLIQGGENGLPTERFMEQTVLVLLSPPPTKAEWPDVYVLVLNWVDFGGGPIPTDP